MYINRLPTIEDLREYQFAQPEPSTEAQQQAASDFIDALDLTAGEEQLRPKITFNPVLQRIYQAIQHRALNPDDPDFPELDENITSYISPDKSLFEKAANEVKTFTNSFELKALEKDTKRNRVLWRDWVLKEESKNIQVKEETVNVEETKEKPGDVFGPKQIKDISVINPIGDFNKMINDRHVDRVSEAICKMKNIIRRFIQESLKDSTYDQALECLNTLRESCTKEDEPTEFNEFLKELKKKYSKGKNAKIWEMIREKKVKLITKEESINSSIGLYEAELVIFDV